MTGELWSDIFRLDAIKKSMNSILFRMIFGLVSLIAALVFKFWLVYLILKMIGATRTMWILFWVQIPVLLSIEKIENYLKTLGEQSNRLYKNSRDIGDKWK